MRCISIDQIAGEEIVAQTVIDISGRVLLSKGTRLKSTFVDRLVEMGISSVFIEDEISEGIQIEKTLCDETKNNAALVVKKEVTRFLKTKKINYEEVHDMVSQIIFEVLSSKTGLINLKDIRIKDEQLFYHSVNVCTMAAILAGKMGFTHDVVHKIAVGSLLHDMGKIIIPNEIINKKSKLTDEEFEEIKKHPIYGYNAIKDDLAASPITKMVVYMHHERLDGSGYPNHLKGDKIHYSAQICGICDIFDAMTN